LFIWYNYIRVCDAIIMNEKEFDSSISDYEEIYQTDNYKKQLEWDMAIGLQEVDNLKPSKQLEDLLEKML